MPQLARDGKPPQRMRNRERLSKLTAAYDTLRLLGCNSIHIKMKTPQILAE